MNINNIPYLRQMTHLPVIADPSHSTGKRDLVAPIALAAIAAGAQGLIVEVHYNPGKALCDGAQSLDTAGALKLFNDAKKLYKTLETFK
jgi:3-deoxy-7-phosphoheptulonate synthase